MADEREWAGRERVDDAGEVRRELRHAVVRNVRPATLAVTAEIERDHAPAGDERRDDRREPVRVRAVPVHEHDDGILVASPHDDADAERSHRHDERPFGLAHVQSASNAASARGTTDS